jgi:hypothetical protein
MIQWNQKRTDPDWIDTSARRAARNRNWALYVARGMYTMILGNRVFRQTLSPFMYKTLCNVINDVCWELEQQYPHAPAEKRIKRRKGI